MKTSEKLMIKPDLLMKRFKTFPYCFKFCDHLKIAEDFAFIHNDCLRFCNDNKQWYYYDGRAWRLDKADNFAKAYINQFVTALTEYAKHESQTEGYYNIVKGYNKSRKSLLEDAQTFYSFSFKEFEEPFDSMLDEKTKKIYSKRKHLFNCQNGTYDLETFTFREHRAEDMLFEISNVVYDEKAISKGFEKFVSEIMENDQDKMNLLQKAMSMGLLSGNSYAKFFILYGKTTRNGKSVLNNVMLSLLGKDYGDVRQPEVFAYSQKQVGAAYEDLASLNKLRYISLNEPPEKMVLDSALLKAVTGNDPSAFRGLYSKIDSFRACYTLYIITNHLPQVNDRCIFDSDRVIVIPFERHFAAKDQDLSLTEKLTTPDSLSGIFNWLIEGLKKLKKEGLVLPLSIQEATNAYQRATLGLGDFIDEKKVANEMLQTFINDVFVKEDGSYVLGDEVSKQYMEWYKSHDSIYLSKESLYKALRDMKLLYNHTVNGYTQKNVLTGYRLKDNAMEVQNEVQDEENEIVVDILNEKKDELKDEYNIENNNGWGFDF